MNKMRKIRKTPGYNNAYLVETAPQLGVRITRILNGLKTVTVDDIRKATQHPDVIGVGGASHAEHGEWQIPYGALVPQTVDNVLAAGRCISGDQMAMSSYRVMATCAQTGFAAGVIAALAAARGEGVGSVPYGEVRRALLAAGQELDLGEYGEYLGRLH